MHGAAEKRGSGERIVRNKVIVTAATKIVIHCSACNYFICPLTKCMVIFSHFINKTNPGNSKFIKADEGRATLADVGARIRRR